MDIKDLNSTDPLDHMPLEVWVALHPLILGLNDTNLELKEPHLKEVFDEYFCLIVFAYGLLICFGFLSNLVVYTWIILRKLYKDETFSFLLNVCVSDLIKCCFVVPISLYVLLIRNWVLGELMCNFLPMIQDMPVHVSTLSFLILIWDRYRYIKKPYRSRFPAFVCNFGIWLVSFIFVLPYLMFIMYLDLGQVYPKLPLLQGVGICTINLLDDIKHYARGVFIILFVAPLSAELWFILQIYRDFSKQNPEPAIKYEASKKLRAFVENQRNNSHEEIRILKPDKEPASRSGSLIYPDPDPDTDKDSPFPEFPEPTLNVIKERKIQKFLNAIMLIYGICLTPVTILKMVRLVVPETYGNMKHLDVAFVVFVWIYFLPTCTTPVIIIIWQMKSSSWRILKLYFNPKKQDPTKRIMKDSLPFGSCQENEKKILHCNENEDLYTSHSCLSST